MDRLIVEFFTGKDRTGSAVTPEPAPATAEVIADFETDDEVPWPDEAPEQERGDIFYRVRDGSNGEILATGHQGYSRITDARRTAGKVVGVNISPVRRATKGSGATFRVTAQAEGDPRQIEVRDLRTYQNDEAY